MKYSLFVAMVFLFALNVKADSLMSQDVGNRVSAKIDQSGVASLRQSQQGLDSTKVYRKDYSAVTVSSAAYSQIISSLPNESHSMFVFDSSGQTVALAVGSAGHEVDQVYIPPGGLGLVNLYIPTGSAVSLKGISGDATSGEIDINFLR